MSIPIHWKHGDACDLRGARGTVLSVLRDGMVVVDLGGGRAVTVAREMLELVPRETPNRTCEDCGRTHPLGRFCAVSLARLRAGVA